MSELTQFRDHARFMAAAKHAPGCPPVRSTPHRAHYGNRKWCTDEQGHDQHVWQFVSPLSDLVIDWTCPGICGGCVNESDRELWSRLATEIDDHLAEHIEVDLFGNEAAEPAPANRNDEGADS